MAVAGVQGRASAGVDGEISIQWWDSKSACYYTLVGHIGDGDGHGLEPDTFYQVVVTDGQAEFVKA
jgi:hypothetical protein